MAFQILKFKAREPLLNEPYTGVQWDSRMRTISTEIMRRIKQTPELVGMLDTVVTDHFQGPIDFFTPTGKSLGPTKFSQVKKFWRDAKVMQAFYGQGIDFFVDGSSFGWHVDRENLLTPKQKESIAKLKAINSQFNTTLKETLALPQRIGYLAASTVEINTDKYGETGYTQEAQGNTTNWKPEEVVHIKLMEFNGEARGFSGLKALIRETAVMFMLKENILAKLKNGGSPDNIISIMGNNIGFNRARFERLKTALESFSHLKKSHGNMPLDAEVKVWPLGTSLKDMEYRELAMFVISEFMLALGVPTSRVPFLMTGSGGTANKGELSANTEDAYQKKINNRRLNWEDRWNTVFEKAGFIFQFRRDNLQDEVRETQAAQQNIQKVISIQDSLAKSGKQLTTQAHLQFLSGKKRDVSEEDVEEMDKDLFMMRSSPSNMASQNSKPSNSITEGRSQFHTKFASNNGVSA